MPPPVATLRSRDVRTSVGYAEKHTTTRGCTKKGRTRRGIVNIHERQMIKSYAFHGVSFLLPLVFLKVKQQPSMGTNEPLTSIRDV